MGGSLGNTDAAIRYASAIAAFCGLQVSIEAARCPSLDDRSERPCPVWRGTADQFRRLWFLTQGEGLFVEMKHIRWLAAGWLRGHLYRDGPDAFRYVIESGFLSRQMENRIHRKATEDAGFQRFLAAAVPVTRGR